MHIVKLKIFRKAKLIFLSQSACDPEKSGQAASDDFMKNYNRYQKSVLTFLP